jgi:hypothetical protein
LNIPRNNDVLDSFFLGLVGDPPARSDTSRFDDDSVEARFADGSDSLPLQMIPMRLVAKRTLTLRIRIVDPRPSDDEVCYGSAFGLGEEASG